MAKKKKKSVTSEWVDLNELHKIHASYYILIGKRSNGKTYAVKNEILEEISKGNQFVYIRRRHSQITRRKMVRLFDDIDDVCNEKLGSSIDYSTDKGFYTTIDGELKTVGVALSLQDYIDDKGIPYNKCTIVLFDEFVDISYLENETQAFLNVISTIVRKRKNVRIYMCANSTGTYSPYFDLFKIDRYQLRKGCIHTVQHQHGVKIAIQYFRDRDTPEERFKKHQDVYLGFDDNETVKMILFGDWEKDDCNIKEIDGVGWNCERKLAPFYTTYQNRVFEISLFQKAKLPIVFVRQINTQNGNVRKYIRYNYSIDNTQKLTTQNGIVPYIAKFNSLIDKNCYEFYSIIKKTFELNRVVFDSLETGTYFNEIIKHGF